MLETSGYILLWCLAFAFAWAELRYWSLLYRGSRPLSRRPGAAMMLPALIWAILAIVVFRRFCHIDLIFPLHIDATRAQLVRAALAPAAVLFFASGLWSGLGMHIADDMAYWQGKAFIRATRGRGCSLPRALHRVVVYRSLAQAWQASLPWLFSELVVAEALFNAPGLGLDAWHMARQHSLSGLSYDLACLAGLYGGVYGLNYAWQKRLGQKLAGYA